MVIERDWKGKKKKHGAEMAQCTSSVHGLNLCPAFSSPLFSSGKSTSSILIACDGEGVSTVHFPPTSSPPPTSA